MLFLIVFAVTLLILTIGSVALFRHTHTIIVAEDSIAITVNKDGFIKRILSEGRNVLHPYERIEFAVEIKTKLAKNRAANIASSDGILVNIDWSGTYALRPDLIADEGRNQKLRSLPKAEKAITRNADILLRKLIGSHPVRDLFNPAIRDRLERQLSQLIIDRLKPLGIALNSINLQTIQLPYEVAEALNKSKAIETLDGAIRQLDPTPREVVRGAYPLADVLPCDL